MPPFFDCSCLKVTLEHKGCGLNPFHLWKLAKEAEESNAIFAE